MPDLGDAVVGAQWRHMKTELVVSDPFRSRTPLAQHRDRASPDPAPATKAVLGLLIRGRTQSIGQLQCRCLTF